MRSIVTTFDRGSGCRRHYVTPWQNDFARPPPVGRPAIRLPVGAKPRPSVTIVFALHSAAFRFVEMPGQRRDSCSGGQGGITDSATLSTEESHRNHRFEQTRDRMLREALMVLIHHNLVVVDSQLEHEYYVIDADEIIHRLSHPKYCQHIKESMQGDAAADCELIVLTILQNGRLTKMRSIQLASEVAKTLGGTRRRESSEKVAKRFNEAWMRLEKAKYIVPAPCFGQLRDGAGGVRNAGHYACTSSKRPTNDYRVRASKRRQLSSADHSEISASQATSSLWQVGVAMIRQELRHKACVSLVAAKRGPHAGIVVETMLQYTRASDETDIDYANKASHSQALPLEVLYTLLPDTIEWSSADLEAKLEEL